MALQQLQSLHEVQLFMEMVNSDALLCDILWYLYPKGSSYGVPAVPIRTPSGI